jgi:hypothetical protein
VQQPLFTHVTLSCRHNKYDVVQELHYGLDDGGSVPGRENDVIFFPSLPRLDRLWGTPSLLCIGHWEIFLREEGVKRPELEADLSPPPGTEVKNAWSCILTHS